MVALFDFKCAFMVSHLDFKASSRRWSLAEWVRPDAEMLKMRARAKSRVREAARRLMLSRDVPARFPATAV